MTRPASTFGTLTRRQLKFRVSIRPLSPVHIGVGNEFLGRGAYHLNKAQTNLALLAPRPLASRLLDHFGDQTMPQIPQLMQNGKYPDHIAQDIENGKLALRRMSVHPGALPFVGRNGSLKTITTQANGLPYIPGSSVKGALRTAWLDWQTQQGGAYERFVTAVAHSKLRGRDADNELLDQVQASQSLPGLAQHMKPESRNYPNRDIFRAIQVSDLIPERSGILTCVYAVLAMSYNADSELGYTRPSDNGGAGAQAWECLDPGAGVTYSGWITVDLDTLDRLISRNPTTSERAKNPDLYNLAEALREPKNWTTALRGFGNRVYGTEEQHYDLLRGRPKQRSKGIQIQDGGQTQLIYDWIKDSAQQKRANQLFPLGMGTGLLAHTLLGVFNPNLDESSEDSPEYLGDEPYRGDTLTGEVLKSGKPNNGFAYLPAPKSRRVTGSFPGSGRRQDSYTGMSAERPLGWTALTLEEETP